MGNACNRMLPRAVTIAASPTDTTIFGVGREGVMNGGSTLNVLVDGRTRTLNGVVIPAITADITVTVWFRNTPTDQPWLSDTVTIAFAVPAAAYANIGISPPDSNVYEVVLIATSASQQTVVVSSLTQRAA